MHVPYLGPIRSSNSTLSAEYASYSNRKKYRILAVDDQPLNLKIYKMILENLNCDADLAENGLIACQLADENPYDLILMDCQMPVMDGPDAARSIHGKGKLNRLTPIIAITSTLTRSMMERCLESTIDNIVPKPISSGVIIKLLDEWAGKTAGHAIDFTN
jgi:CheY-like chemotaxis protein